MVRRLFEEIRYILMLNKRNITWYKLHNQAQVTVRGTSIDSRVVHYRTGYIQVTEQSTSYNQAKPL